MRFQEFKVWLSGYLEGINLSEEHIKRIMEEMREVRIEADDVYVPINYSKLFHDAASNIHSGSGTRGNKGMPRGDI